MSRRMATDDDNGFAEFNIVAAVCIAVMLRVTAMRNNSVSWLRVQWFFTYVLFIVRYPRDTDPAVD